MGSERKIFLFFFSLVVVLASLLPGNLFAYNEDGRVHFEAGFEAMNRDIQEESAQFLGVLFPKENPSVQSLRLLAKLSVRIIDPIEVYGVAGGSNLKIDDFEYNADFGAAYGGGARIVLFKENSREMPFQIFADYRYLRFKTHDTVLFQPVDENGAPIPAGSAGELLNEKIVWNEHVVKLGFLARHDVFEPYGGVRFSVVNGKDHVPSQFQPLDLHFKQSDTFGVFGGLAYYLLPRSDKAAIFIEGSLFDQYSLAGGIRVGF